MAFKYLNTKEILNFKVLHFKPVKIKYRFYEKKKKMLKKHHEASITQTLS